MSNKKNNAKTKDVSIYTASDYKNDENKFKKSMETGKVDFAKSNDKFAPR